MAAYEHCRQTLQRELDAQPSRETEALRATFDNALAEAAAPTVQRVVPPTVLRPPRLVGREAEWAALERARQARQPALVLAEAGLGKTRLVTEFARAHGAAAIVSARPGDERIVYALATRLLRQLPRETSLALDAPLRKELARLLRELGEAAPISTEAARASTTR